MEPGQSTRTAGCCGSRVRTALAQKSGARRTGLSNSGYGHGFHCPGKQSQKRSLYRLAERAGLLLERGRSRLPWRGQVSFRALVGEQRQRHPLNTTRELEEGSVVQNGCRLGRTRADTPGLGLRDGKMSIANATYEL